jgi:hypothetical protein
VADLGLSNALSARPFVSGWAALECGTLTIEPATVACFVSTTRTLLRKGGGVEIRGGVWESVWARCWVLKVRSLPSVFGSEGQPLSVRTRTGHLSGWLACATARVLRTSQWTRASL